MKQARELLTHIPVRPGKPRKEGLTMVMDKGLSLREAEDFAGVGSEYVDFVKLGFGTSVITPNVDKKIKTYHEAGMTVYFGGTLFEAFIIRGLFAEYVDLLKHAGVRMVEISDGSYEFDHSEKLQYIRKLSKDFTVISEVGSKKKNIIYTPAQWVEMMKAELDAGSVKVIAEARESGTIGIYNDDGSVNKDLIGTISREIGFDNVLWEAPLKQQQAWFIAHFGANVNLGNIAPNEIIALESLRLGLRSDTFFSFLPDHMK
ncbi:MAG: phosphosulfolactate synthase [Bacteroidales bacterium]|jgi:phosphosulfolactate synthase|nr:phosphosulfolactate synthase [Bacteroidales bacterium]MDX9926120.1 phosphosulfolactate synthase [Bacteroidales bacterium]HNX83599.1 phosphosulfolactate synthase [Bacteroidales bacterium]HOC47963.1 phosphosulfolactate synthase [Bacteroidales bacterium]HPS96820.1 phosphosulfolactate synthase [Bacteroidales bacterium]